MVSGPLKYSRKPWLLRNFSCLKLEATQSVMDDVWSSLISELRSRCDSITIFTCFQQRHKTQKRFVTYIAARVAIWQPSFQEFPLQENETSVFYHDDQSCVYRPLCNGNKRYFCISNYICVEKWWAIERWWSNVFLPYKNLFLVRETSFSDNRKHILLRVEYCIVMDLFFTLFLLRLIYETTTLSCFCSFTDIYNFYVV
jgi:hypothetical protein